MLAISSMRSSLFRAEVSLLVPLRLLRPSWNLDFDRGGVWGRVVGGGWVAVAVAVATPGYIIRT